LEFQQNRHFRYFLCSVAGFPYGPASVITEPLFDYENGYVKKGETRRDGTVDGNIANRQFKVRVFDLIDIVCFELCFN
jgi:hypothetical protein